MQKTKKLSFVIPCYNSEDTIGFVIDELTEIVSESEYSYEIVLVNDDSQDGVLAVLLNYADKDEHITVIDLAKNMGKHSALMAGMANCDGDYIICLDDDGQSPSDRLWDLLAPLQKGYDISIASYPVKKESLSKRIGSRINDLMARVMLSKPKGLKFGNFFAFKRFVKEEMLHYKNPYPYINGLYMRISAHIINVPMEERERVSGRSGYNFRKSFSLFLNGFTAFSVKPLRFASLMGLVASAFGAGWLVVMVIRKFLGMGQVPGYTSLICTQLLVGGCILFALGMIGEYIGRIYISLNNIPQYVIRNVYRQEDEEE